MDNNGKRSRGGPRTPAGKEKSKYNAIKHGLFSQVIVLNHESQSEFDDLLGGLRRTLKPEGPLEEGIVDKIAVILWRYRRFLQAERAGIQREIESQENRDTCEITQFYAEKRIAETDRRGAVRDIDNNPDKLQYCVDRLAEVLENVDAYGLEYGKIAVNLGLVYGARYSGRPGRDLYDDYRYCLTALKSTAEAKRTSMGFESLDDCKRKFVAATEKEIERIESHRKSEPREEQSPTRQVTPMGMDLLKLVILRCGAMDLLSRYETHLDRALDGALKQLQRAQALRQGQ
jgi:hypothetical protein